VAAGKAAVGMAAALDAALGGRLVAGVLTAKVSEPVRPYWRAFAGTHPKPSPGSEAAGRAALELADHTARAGGLLVVCLSGGASAMMAVPAPGLTIEDKAATAAVLLRAGLDIGAMNLVRRHLSGIKGGQLAARARRSITCAISDVCTPVEDDPVVIGSGPTTGDPTTFEQALALVVEHKLADVLPRAVLQHLEAGVRGAAPGPVAPDDPGLREAAYWLVGSRADAMRAAADTAARLGYYVHVERPPVTGEARHAALPLLAVARTLPRPCCVVSSGETTVRVIGGGTGGRNQELALAALEPLASLAPAALASIGTDGIDGPTDAAGAIVDDRMWGQLGPAARATCDAALDDNDAYPLLDRLGALVRTGPSGTNVGDVQVLLLDARASR
jgi:glycerate-2-kinase